MELAMTARPTESTDGYSAQIKHGVRQKIKDLLKQRDATYEDLAAALGVSFVSIARVLGGSQWFSFENLVKASVYLKAPLSELLSFAQADVETGRVKRKNDYCLDDELLSSFAASREVSPERVNEWLKALSRDERALVKLRHLIQPVATMQEMSILFDVSPQRVGQLEKRALEKL